MSGNALVPVDPTRPPAVRRPAPRYNLVSENITFTNRDDVRERLPDILGKALALIWLDKKFADMFARDPQSILESEGIFLPENMAIEFQKPGTAGRELSFTKNDPTRISSFASCICSL